MICVFHKHNDVFTDCPTCMRQDKARAAVTRAEAAATIAQLKLEERNEKRQQELNRQEAAANLRRQEYHAERRREFLKSCDERWDLLFTYAKKRKLTPVAVVDDYSKMKFFFENTPLVKTLYLDDRIFFFGNNLDLDSYIYEGKKHSITSSLEEYPNQISIKWKITRSELDSKDAENIFKSDFKFKEMDLNILFNNETLFELREKTNPMAEIEFRSHFMVFISDEKELKLFKDQLQEAQESFVKYKKHSLSEKYKESKKMPTFILLWGLNLFGIFGWHNIYIGRWCRWLGQCLLTIILFGSLGGKPDDHPWIIYFIGLIWAFLECSTTADSNGNPLMEDPNDKKKDE